MVDKLKFIFKLIRWDDWYNSNLPLLFFIYYYLALVNKEYSLKFFVSLFYLSLFFIFLASFGFMINDYYDKSTDIVVGKNNYMSLLSNSKQIIVLFITLFGGIILLIFPFHRHQHVVLFMILSYLFSILYSSPPFRLKEKGVWGIICVSLAQCIFPSLIIFSIFNNFHMDTLLFITLYFLIGMRWNLIHQYIDRNNDIKSNTNTLAAKMVPDNITSIIYVIFIMELIIFIELCYVMIYTISSLILIPIPIYILLEIYLYPLWVKKGIKNMILSYDTTPLANLYFLWLPLWFSILLGFQNPLLYTITIIEIYWKQNYIGFYHDLILEKNSLLKN